MATPTPTADPTTDPNAPINQPASGGGSVSDFPDMGQLEADVADIEASYEPRIEEQEKLAEEREAEAVRQQEFVSKEAERQAAEMTTEDAEMQHWVDHTPTRQAIAATTMHAAPLLALMTALGGKVTRLNGMQMLAAQTGMMKGLNTANEKLYEDSYNAWQSAYQKMRDHQRRLADAHSMMLTAYAGRADAYQKAAEAARRMTGDLLSAQQRQIEGRVNLFKAQTAAADKLARIDLGNRQLNEKARHDIAQEGWWKQKLASSGALPSDIKLELATEHNRWVNAKAQKDQNLRRRGEINSSLTMPEDQRKAALDRIDMEDEALTMEMDRAQSNADAILAGYEQQNRAGAAPGAPALRPGSVTPPPGTARAGFIQRTPAAEYAGQGGSPGEPPGGSATPDNPRGAAGRPPYPPGQAGDNAPAIDPGGAPPAVVQALRTNPRGSVVHASDGSAWVVNDQGQVQRVQ